MICKKAAKYTETLETFGRIKRYLEFKNDFDKLWKRPATICLKFGPKVVKLKVFFFQKVTVVFEE